MYQNLKAVLALFCNAGYKTLNTKYSESLFMDVCAVQNFSIAKIWEVA